MSSWQPIPVFEAIGSLFCDRCVPMRQLGKYEIIQEIGRGGFAVVYKARDTSLDRIVALKVLAPHLTWERESVARFQNEARSVARLRHPNIVTVHEAGEQDGQLYIAMEYLEGRTLAQVIEAEGALPLAQALPILGQIAEALDYAHKQRVLHRDVKPANVMVKVDDQSTPRATLMDFGLVKAMSESIALTSHATLLGSPEYMAPEQADSTRRDEIGPATDRYALGVVAYQMLTGQVPFSGPTTAVLHMHAYESPPNPQSIRRELLPGVVWVLRKALSKSTRGRYSTAVAMVDALRRAGEKAFLAHAAAGLGLLWFSTWKWVLVGVLVIALLGSSVWLGSRIRPRPTPTVIVRRTTATSVPSATNTPLPAATFTPKSTATSVAVTTPAPTPTWEILTQVREKDGAVMVYVPAGEFWIGSDDSDPDAHDDQKPQRRVFLGAFWIDQTEVTNAQYKTCANAGACSPPSSARSHTRDSYYDSPEYGDHPVIYVSWRQAKEYAQWVGGRLPTEAEWEYAARGPDGNIYPWGNAPPNDSLLNYNDPDGDTAAVGSYPGGASWCGALDMAGNVWEWTNSLYKLYPYDAADGREDPDAEGDRVDRGGSWQNEQVYARCAFRSKDPPHYQLDVSGFRVVISPTSP